MFPTLACVSNPYWNDGWNIGHNCAWYEEYYCANGRPKNGYYGMMTEYYNNPDQHCCGCGKSRKGISKLPDMFIEKFKSSLFLFSQHSIITHLVTADCEWKEWGRWTACSKPCGGGQKTRKRTVKTPARNGGEECSGTPSDEQGCNTDACPGLWQLKALYWSS